ncbi:hypothetical protein HRR83_005019 [Exophiala dermatitidis]|nr:hypothetical protein HRR73_003815 [Exophiala dermatitidis]KAJ4541336.1 hypothetical protein HRR77_006134 [Exophiala dermatitidis]KAJ4576406.1 hypothetical protein HRR82_005806 [Exophiala dermatitidis]KAJ4596468.1 hypothetical protein HRR83_005019 [Exophiala dermatitidis]KAJ4617776.1 hypothetical protein HRR85_002766 [Exophiala dermatitidis]
MEGHQGRRGIWLDAWTRDRPTNASDTGTEQEAMTAMGPNRQAAIEPSNGGSLGGKDREGASDWKRARVSQKDRRSGNGSNRHRQCCIGAQVAPSGVGADDGHRGLGHGHVHVAGV